MRSVKTNAAPLRRGEFVTRRLNGGLNYNYTYGLTASELRDGADFDIFESGAIGSRRALIPFTTCDLGQEILNAWAWQDLTGVDYMFVVLADGLISVASDGDDCFVPSVFGTMTDGDSRCVPHAWSAGGWLYVSDGDKVWRWGGTGFPTYTVVENFFPHPMSVTPEVTNRGVIPACAAAVYRDTVFLGNTLAYMTDPDAVWWSAAVAEQPDGSPLEGLLTGQEDYYEQQRITFIAGNQADRINKLLAAGPALYAFKRHSVHALSTNGSTVLNNDISTEVGLAGENACAAYNGSVWFFDEHEGLHLMGPNALPEKVFDPIYPLLDCGRIRNPQTVAVGVDGDKVFVSVSLDIEEAINNVTFVLNTKISSTSKGGAWSRWNVGFSNFVRWQPQEGDSSLVGFTTGYDGRPQGAVRVNECSTSIEDDYGFTTTPVVPWFVTAYFDDNLPTITKRWERLALTITGTDEVNLNAAASTAPRDIGRETCELPEVDQPILPNDGNGIVRVDLTPYVCEEVAYCDRDSRGVTYDNGFVVCEDPVVGTGVEAGRVKRIASPGRGVAFSLRVTDVGSLAPWTIEELDCKYSAVVEYA